MVLDKSTSHTKRKLTDHGKGMFSLKSKYNNIDIGIITFNLNVFLTETEL